MRFRLRAIAIIVETSWRQLITSFATQCVKTQLNNLIVFGKESVNVAWNPQHRRNANAMCVASTGTNQWIYTIARTEPNMTSWHISHVGGHLNNVIGLMYVVGDKLRIAQGHLTNADKSKKFYIEMTRRRAVFRPK